MQRSTRTVAPSSSGPFQGGSQHAQRPSAVRAKGASIIRNRHRAISLFSTSLRCSDCMRRREIPPSFLLYCITELLCRLHAPHVPCLQSPFRGSATLIPFSVAPQPRLPRTPASHIPASMSSSPPILLPFPLPLPLLPAGNGLKDGVHASTRREGGKQQSRQLCEMEICRRGVRAGRRIMSVVADGGGGNSEGHEANQTVR